MIREYPGNLLKFLLESEYAARERGDEFSADAWLDIALEAAELLREYRRP